MTDKEIEAGIERACECGCAPPSTGWTVNPFPIIRDYISRLKERAESAEARQNNSLCNQSNLKYDIRTIIQDNISDITREFYTEDYAEYTILQMDSDDYYECLDKIACELLQKYSITPKGHEER